MFIFIFVFPFLFLGVGEGGFLREVLATGSSCPGWFESLLFFVFILFFLQDQYLALWVLRDGNSMLPETFGSLGRGDRLNSMLRSSLLWA